MPTGTNLRFASDWRGSRVARRYMWTGILTPGAATAGTNLMGVRKTAANPEVFISRIRVHVFTGAAAGVAAPLGWKRATTVAGGTQVTAADIPDLDSAAGNATLEVRTGAVTFGTEANQYILTHPAAAAAAPAAGVGHGFLDDWTARDLSERIRLTADEGMILEFVTAGDTDNRIYVMLVWEEVA